jgi:hypothetical protein
MTNHFLNDGTFGILMGHLIATWPPPNSSMVPIPYQGHHKSRIMVLPRAHSASDSIKAQSLTLPSQFTPNFRQ